MRHTEKVHFNGKVVLLSVIWLHNLKSVIKVFRSILSLARSLALPLYLSVSLLLSFEYFPSTVAVVIVIVVAVVVVLIVVVVIVVISVSCTSVCIGGAHQKLVDACN